MLLVWVTLLFVVSISVSQVAAQAPGAPNCALFTTMSEEHGKKAQAIEQEAAEQAKTLAGDAAKANSDIAARAAKSEWEMAALSREAARKCLQDYLSGSQAAAPAAPAPVQQAAPVVIEQPAPVVVRQPAPVVRQAAPVVIQQPAPVVVEQVVPVQPFHSTAVSAMAFGGAAFGMPGNRGSGVQRIPGNVQRIPENFFGRQGAGGKTTIERQPDGTETATTIVRQPDGTETQTIVRSHNKQTSTANSGTIVTKKTASGGTVTTTKGVQRNPDGTFSTGASTSSQFRPGGATHVEGIGRKSDGTKTEIKVRDFQNFNITRTTTTNPDGTVKQENVYTDKRTGVSRVLPNTPPTSNPPPKNPNPIVKAVGKKSSTPIKPVGQR